MTTEALLDLIRRELQSELGPNYRLAVNLPWVGDVAAYAIQVMDEDGLYAQVLYDDKGSFHLEGPPVGAAILVVEMGDPDMFKKLAEKIRWCRTQVSMTPS